MEEFVLCGDARHAVEALGFGVDRNVAEFVASHPARCLGSARR
jgi:hypothetical protein